MPSVVCGAWYILSEVKRFCDINKTRGKIVRNIINMNVKIPGNAKSG